MRPLLLNLGVALLLSACGQSGKLVLPEKATKPAPAAQSAPAPADKDADKAARPPAAPQPSAPTPP